MINETVIIHIKVNGNYCLTCGSDKTVRLWNPHRGLLIKTYKGPGAEVFDADAYGIQKVCLA